LSIGKAPDQACIGKTSTADGYSHLAFASPTTIGVYQVLDDMEPPYLPSDGRTSSASMTSAGSTLPGSAQGAGERTRYRNPVAVASCSWVEAEVVEWKQRSVR